MDVKASVKTVRSTPQKARLVIDLIRGKDVNEAFAMLRLTNKKACEPIYKVLHSACANAENNNGMDVNSLYVKEAYVNDGPRMKRLLPRSKGRGEIIIKRTCHITIVVAEKN